MCKIIDSILRRPKICVFTHLLGTPWMFGHHPGVFGMDQSSVDADQPLIAVTVDFQNALTLLPGVESVVGENPFLFALADVADKLNNKGSNIDCNKNANYLALNTLSTRSLIYL